ncbi:MAG: cell filamentation protein Fic [Candidatus Levybacteria bacterium RIFCSPHIGHO2_02_FULL_39_36]|uniref:Cell filamentation protein Fic n=1 Tax=Candidatus Gottesmanbacteria bacterium RIFCSPHIGHO2_01_FULL_39_10 TaxID=1798375 RepID=A0A1F5ZT23_9BACT|nr:MAG: cell filamentation protein Fic [Candidatus Gottesmanbacteria bacterium RIFCSPHIGHO2_01_FULL_39_10]OGH27782.1 MAG: cell filamentation protein Fic [Candidatus Levybacteria bacterium RIFCSPHIGHO2_02_FULL_39_36]
MSKYPYETLSIIEPAFNSNLTDLIIELDYLRKKKLGGSTHPRLFFQLKGLFHTLESIGSARIEGNHTTIAEFIETKIEKQKTQDEKIKEIQNLERAMDFIDKNINDYPINDAFIRELHKLVVKNLSSNEEGDEFPGEYRRKNIKISKAIHIPPDYTQVHDYMEELNKFINKKDLPKYDLLKTTLTHHRFVWIHPFGNGNGRVVRLITYAQLIKSGFNVGKGRIVNPTAIFCNNREKYYDYLSTADLGTYEGLLGWCEYVLTGLKKEIEKIDHLLDYKYLSEKILLPAIDFSHERKVITKIESEILKIAVKKQLFQAGDLKAILPDTIPAQTSRILNRLKSKNMISSEHKKSRKYLIDFRNNYLLRGVIKMLDQHDFLPLKNES